MRKNFDKSILYRDKSLFGHLVDENFFTTSNPIPILMCSIFWGLSMIIGLGFGQPMIIACTLISAAPFTWMFTKAHSVEKLLRECIDQNKPLPLDVSKHIESSDQNELLCLTDDEIQNLNDQALQSSAKNQKIWRSWLMQTEAPIRRFNRTWLMNEMAQEKQRKFLLREKLAQNIIIIEEENDEKINSVEIDANDNQADLMRLATTAAPRV